MKDAICVDVEQDNVLGLAVGEEVDDPPGQLGGLDQRTVSLDAIITKAAEPRIDAMHLRVRRFVSALWLR